jgi:D-beta-D-heptose 7-phosphate kinase/D-beta-D-heptose 1-phosphate adenosyltransferase
MPQEQDIFSKFSKVKILVIGDVMLDRYWWGSVDRISPEAPVPVVRLNSADTAAGGAANVAANIAGLGATPFLVGLVGDDREAEELKNSLTARGIDPQHLQSLNGRPTTVKTRVVAHSHHVVRIDSEHTEEIGADSAESIWQSIEPLVGQADVVLLSDYAKGMLSAPVLSRIVESCEKNSKPLLVDPKGRDYRKYSGATLLTPNRSEAIHAAGVEDLEEAAARLIDEVKLESLIITQGENGMTLYRRGDTAVNFPALARKVYDVTGAGDTVISTLAVALGAGLDLPTAAKLANIAAGLVVEEVGTTVIALDQLKEAAENW